MTLTQILELARPFDFDWGGYSSKEDKVMTQTLKALRHYADMGLIPHSVSYKLNRRSKKTAGWFKVRGTRTNHTSWVELAKWFVDANVFEEIEGTIKHEIAHAIEFHNLGGRVGHDYRWVAIATAIGDDGARCYDSKKVVNNTKFKYTLICDHCGHKHGMTKVSRKRKLGVTNSSCGQCGGRSYNPSRLMRLVQNY